MMTSAEIRQSFLEYFRAQGHEVVPSSSLVPANDPTLLFTNAGMVQFKDVFLGKEQRPYRRATSAQRCVRAGGKHNDLENVGYTARHHTFFEMLGNFSFGDYFKREAIGFAWEYLTGVLKLPADRLWVTVFEQDDEAAAIWLDEIGVDPQRFSRIGEKDNFWSMGDTGPCGPCSEIFYDHGPEVAGGPPGTPEADGDRYIEIWNLVFMQYDRDAKGQLHPLPKPSVDTGMGLERLAAVLQGVHDNYEIDLFRALIDAIAVIAEVSDHRNTSLKVIADHIRASAFLIVDGVLPANEGRGYVLRRIIRRACRHGHKLGLKEPFFYRMVEPLVAQMGAAYPELKAGAEQAARVIQQEELRFAQTLEQGLGLLEQAIATLPGKVIPGETVFQLYDTYGFPVDLTADIARERGLLVDMEGFERAMAEQRATARAASQFKVQDEVNLESVPAEIIEAHRFSGYEQDEDEASVVAIFQDGQAVESLAAGAHGVIVLDGTPFYAESGGQVGDAGVLAGEHGRFEVQDTQKRAGVFVHMGVVAEGLIARGERVHARVDVARRERIRRNHSATHLLNAALRRILGKHVVQKGSLVTPERLRFDFSHSEPVRAEQLIEIEDLVNGWVLSNQPAVTRLMPYPEAVAAGALAMAGEKYAEEVRVLALGDYSVELCGGIHVHRTGDIGLFKIVNESGVAAGVRRIEAVTGLGALAWVREQERLLRALAEAARSTPEELPRRFAQLQDEARRLEREVARLKQQLISGQGSDLSAQAVTIGDTQVVAARLDGVDAKTLREAVDQLKSKLQQAAIILASVGEDDKVTLIAGVTNNRTDRIKAGELANFVAEQVGGRGGGRPDLAQAGGKDPAHLDQALEAVPDWVRQRLA